TDWRHYVRKYPWLCLGATAAAGYLLVPRSRPSAGEVAATGKNGSTGNALKQSAGGLVSAIAGMAIRTAASAVVRQGLTFLKQQKTAHAASPPTERPPARDPESFYEAEPW